jgi:hypothetical protein
MNNRLSSPLFDNLLETVLTTNTTIVEFDYHLQQV